MFVVSLKCISIYFNSYGTIVFMGSESSPISIKYMMKMLIILGILRNEIMNIVKRPLTHYKQTKKYKEQIYTNEW